MNDRFSRLLFVLAAAVFSSPLMAQTLSAHVRHAPPIESIWNRTTVAEPSLIPAPGAQSTPAIASNGESYFAVWADRRYGNFDVFGTRISPAGEPLDPAGIPISPTFKNDLDPAVAWGPEEFLVAWSTDIGIFGVRLSRDGKRLGGDKLVAPLVEGHPMLDTALAWNGQTYLVTWSEQSSSASPQRYLFGILLDATGKAVTERFLISSGPGVVNSATASAGTGYVVVWEEAAAETSGAVLTAHISGEGVKGPSLAIGRRPRVGLQSTLFDDAAPAVASNGSHYLVVWAQGAIRSQLLSATGALVGLPRDHGWALGTPVTPAVAATADGWLVLWSSSIFDATGNLSSYDISSLPLNRDGTRKREVEVALRASNGQFDAAIATAGNSVMAIWRDDRLNSRPSDAGYSNVLSEVPGDVFAGPFSQSGIVSGNAQPAAFGEAGQFPEDIAASGDIIFAIWREQLDDDDVRYLSRRLHSSGIPLDPEPVELIGRRPASLDLDISATASDDEFLVKWSDATDSGDWRIYARRITTSGMVVDEQPLVITEQGRWASVASDGRDFLIVWREEPGTENDVAQWELRVVALTAAGLSSPGGIAIPDSRRTSPPLVVFNGRNYLAVWNRDRPIVGRFISRTGVPEGPLPVSVGGVPGQGPPVAIASSGREHLFALWAYGYVVSLDGLPSPFPVTYYRGRTITDAVWGGVAYVVAPDPIAATGAHSVAMIASATLRKLPSAHIGGVSRVYLAVFATARQRGASRSL